MSKLPEVFNAPARDPRKEVNRIVRKLGYEHKDFNFYWNVLYHRYDPYTRKIKWPKDYFVRDCEGYVMLDSNRQPLTNYENISKAFKLNNIPHPLDQIDKKGDMDVLLKEAHEINIYFTKED